MSKEGVLFRKIAAFNEISLLVFSLVAFVFIIGESERVSADRFTADKKNLPQASTIPTKSSAGGSGVTPHVFVASTSIENYKNIVAKLNLDQTKKDALVRDFSKRAQDIEGQQINQKALSDAEAALRQDADFQSLPAGDQQKLLDAQKSALQIGAGGGSYSYEIPVIGYKITNFLTGNLVEGLVWSVAVVGVIQLVGPLLGAKPELTNALSAAAFAGIMGGKLAFGLFGEATSGLAGSGGILSNGLSATYAGLIGVGVAVVVFAIMYKKESKKVVELQCLPWEAPLGGKDCEKCNGDPLKPCSEYRCKSLGQACELVNVGSAEERCVWQARNDVSSPTITPWKQTLSEGHKYTDMQGRPPSRGTKIVKNDNNCIKPFTPLKFGVTLNEPAQCKIDLEGNKSFEQMSFYFGESNLFRYNHSEQLRLPSVDSLSVEGEGIDVPTEGNYNFYVRCQDANGNVNEDEFVFNICVDKSPDTTAPVIESTSIVSGSAITFGTQNVTLGVNINEPAECKWSVQDKDYGLMENMMSCSTHVYEQNARQLYPCTTTLAGLKDNSVNNFYFRCKDQPLKNDSERNVNQQSYLFALRGSQTLNILSAGPNETFTGSTDVINVNLSVKTDDGADEGKAICYFSSTGKEGDYVAMFKTNSFVHEQILSLPSGGYTYYFRCVDSGGNAAAKNVSFNVLIDREAPSVTRVYKEGPDALKVITSEPAQCRYSLTSCNFVLNEGILMQLLGQTKDTVHAAPWKPNQALYIKCRDLYGNEPGPNLCSVIASASSVS